MDSSNIEIEGKVDKDEDGKYELIYSSLIPKQQHKDIHECYKNYVDLGIKDFTAASLALTRGLHPEYLDTDFGYKIDKACIDNWGREFIPLVKKTITQGLSCLQNLAAKRKDKSKISGALRNAFEVTKLLKEKKVTLLCSEIDYEGSSGGWTGVAANASAQPTDQAQNLPVLHPYISLNPHNPQDQFSHFSKAQKSKSFLYSNRIELLQRTIFHEQLHNPGNLHASSIEYPYACEVCCINPNRWDKAHAVSCKICAGEYENNTDPKFINDIEELALINLDSSYKSDDDGDDDAILSIAKSHLGNLAKENPKDLTIEMRKLRLGYLGGDILTPAVSKYIRKQDNTLKTKKLLFGTEKDNLKDSSVEKSRDIIAQATFFAIYESDLEKALSILEDNKEIIHNELEKPSKNSPHSNELKYDLQLVIWKLWTAEDIDKTYTRLKALQNYFADKNLLRVSPN